MKGMIRDGAARSEEPRRIRVPLAAPLPRRQGSAARSSGVYTTELDRIYQISRQSDGAASFLHYGKFRMWRNIFDPTYILQYVYFQRQRRSPPPKRATTRCVSHGITRSYCLRLLLACSALPYGFRYMFIRKPYG